MTSKYLSRSTNDGTARSFPYNPPKVHPGEFRIMVGGESLFLLPPLSSFASGISAHLR